jgi:PAS domain S-box-containing protein
MASGLQSLLENTAGLSHELLFEADLGGALLLVNPAWARVLGWSAAELGAMSFYDLVHPDDLQNAREAMMAGIESATAFPLEARFRGKDGVHHRISWNLLAQRSVLHGAGHDVTAMTEAAGAVREYEQVLRQNQGSGAANPYTKVGHDINNLMQNIIGALELIRMLHRTGRGAETDRFMTSAIQSAHRAAELNQQRVVSSSPGMKTVDEGAAQQGIAAEKR